jgi:hypothetical protein
MNMLVDQISQGIAAWINRSGQRGEGQPPVAPAAVQLPNVQPQLTPGPGTGPRTAAAAGNLNDPDYRARCVRGCYSFYPNNFYFLIDSWDKPACYPPGMNVIWHEAPCRLGEKENIHRDVCAERQVCARPIPSAGNLNDPNYRRRCFSGYSYFSNGQWIGTTGYGPVGMAGPTYTGWFPGPCPPRAGVHKYVDSCAGGLEVCGQVATPPAREVESSEPILNLLGQTVQGQQPVQTQQPAEAQQPTLREEIRRTLDSVAPPASQGAAPAFQPPPAAPGGPAPPARATPAASAAGGGSATSYPQSPPQQGTPPSPAPSQSGEQRAGFQRIDNFNGVSDYLNAAPPPNTNVFSVSVWFRTNSNKRQQSLVGNYRPCSYTPPGFQLLLYNTPGNTGVTLYKGGGGGNALVRQGAFNDGRWHHAAAVFGPSSYALFVDGSVAGVKQGSYIPTSYPVKVGAADAAVAGCGYTGESYFQGQIADVATYARALSEAEVQQIYRARAVDSSAAGQPSAPPSSARPAGAGSTYRECVVRYCPICASDVVLMERGVTPACDACTQGASPPR